MGVRIDSGDLAYLSRRVRAAFIDVSEKFQVPLGDMTIVASNDLTEAVLSSLQQQPHSIDTFAVGTHLVTCRDQPALGCVYKCVSVGGQPRMKLSEDRVKITLPGAKRGYRLANASGESVLDLLCQADEPAPVPGQKVLCRHPFDANRRVLVTAAAVTPLHHLVWQGKVVASTYLAESRVLNPREAQKAAPAADAAGVVLDGGHPIYEPVSVVRARVLQQLSTFREDHLRRLNPTPYKLSLSASLYDYLHELWLRESPIREIE
jgi:nicotinate phosphoribosyltransferase